MAGTDNAGGGNRIDGLGIQEAQTSEAPWAGTDGHYCECPLPVLLFLGIQRWISAAGGQTAVLDYLPVSTRPTSSIWLDLGEGLGMVVRSRVNGDVRPGVFRSRTRNTIWRRASPG